MVVWLTANRVQSIDCVWADDMFLAQVLRAISCVLFGLELREWVVRLITRKARSERRCTAWAGAYGGRARFGRGHFGRGDLVAECFLAVGGRKLLATRRGRR